MYIPKSFELYELLPRDVYEATIHYGNNRFQWFDDRALISLQSLREWAGKTLVNNWYWGGNNQWGGLRPFDCPIGALYSQHKFGRAFDAKFADKTADEARHYIRSNKAKFPYITCLEEGVGWCHLDTRNYDGLLIIHGG